MFLRLLCVFLFVSCVCPSRDDDVITSPYNSVLALNELIQQVQCKLAKLLTLVKGEKIVYLF